MTRRNSETKEQRDLNGNLKDMFSELSKLAIHTANRYKLAIDITLYCSAKVCVCVCCLGVCFEITV